MSTSFDELIEFVTYVSNDKFDNFEICIIPALISGNNASFTALCQEENVKECQN